MSVFSDLLSEYITMKDVGVYPLSQFCGLGILLTALPIYSVSMSMKKTLSTIEGIPAEK